MGWWRERELLVLSNREERLRGSGVKFPSSAPGPLAHRSHILALEKGTSDLDMSGVSAVGHGAEPSYFGAKLWVYF